MSIVWKAQEVAEATGGETQGSWQATRVVIDSRDIQQGDLFVAIKGDNFDGHDFAAQALEKGAVAAIVSREISGIPDSKLVMVSDTLTALQALGKAGRDRSKAKFVGVTGSVGKTSTKEMLRAALSVHGNTFASHGNFNNHIGTPLNLANLPLETKYAVCEMGMNHAGEISLLTNILRPHTAMITNVEGVHLEFFESVEGIADAKSEIFEGVEPGGVAVLNADNPHTPRCRKAAEKCGVGKIVTFGKDASADFRLLSCAITPEGTRIKASIRGKDIGYLLGALGEHWACTSLGVLAVVESFGLDIAKTADALHAFKDLPGRGSLHRLTLDGKNILLLDDSYNASPVAVKAAFEKMKALRPNMPKGSRLVAAIGNMLELGEQGPSLHAGLAECAVAAGIDRIYTAGELAKNLYDAMPEKSRGVHAADADALLPILRKELQEGDLLLVKGSHGSHMYKCAEALKNSSSSVSSSSEVLRAV